MGLLSDRAERVPVSLIMVTHNSEQYVGPVLDALLSDPDQPDEIVVVDNASTDGTVALARSRGVDVIEAGENTGFAAGCHLGVGNARHDRIAFLGHDTTPVHGWLRPLVSVLDDPQIGAAMATVEDEAHPGTFNTSGGHLAYYGLAWVSDFGKPIPEEEAVVDVPFPCGGAMAMRRRTWDDYGGFRPQFFMYHEDTDLGWRLRQGGLRVVRVPEARVRHNYQFDRFVYKMYHLERNRWYMVRSNYRRSTLLLLAPALAVVEVGTLVVAIRDGWLDQKLRAWRAVGRSGPVVRQGRAQVKRNRVVGDAEILAGMDYELSGIKQLRMPAGTVVADHILRLWRRLVLPLVRLVDRIS